jgi:hypothetical protein
MTVGPDISSFSHAQKDALIGSLMAQVAALVARVAELEAKLGLPPKTPDNSRLPPSKGQKPSAPAAAKAKANPHAGAHRPLHPDPTSKREFRACAAKAAAPMFRASRRALARATTASKSPRSSSKNLRRAGDLALHFGFGRSGGGGVADGGRQGNSGGAQGEAGGGTRGGADDEALAFVLDLGFGQGIQIGDDFRPAAGATEPGNAIFQRGFQHQRKEVAKHVAADRLVELVEIGRVASRCLAARILRGPSSAIFALNAA